MTTNKALGLVLSALLVGAIVAMTMGCATGGTPDIDQLKQICNAIVDPCEPCPPATPPVTPPTPPVDPPKPPPVVESCDRDGLEPSETFIWKPESDNDGKLAVITPASLICERGVTVFYEKNGSKSERGSSNGVRANGCRLSWRFKQPGQYYGKNIKVVCYDETGNKVWGIPSGAQRVEKH